jgi:hypothetical protein
VTVPTVGEVDAIAALDDPVLRNLRITHCYSELSQCVAVRAAPGANWCTFATWASRQAGQTIRGEDFERAASAILGSPEVATLITSAATLAANDLGRGSSDTLAATIRRVIDPAAALRRAADAVAVGNRKVFMEIGREFARWLATAAASGGPNADGTRQFCEALRSGDPPSGQGLLRDAFVAYGDACGQPNARARAESLFYANLLIGFHEQTRLQPDIQASLDAGLDADAVKQELLALLFPGTWLRTRARIARLTGRPMPADVAIDALVAAVRRRIRLVITDLLMTLRLPGETVHLGSDVRGAFPPDLRQLDHQGLRALLTRVDPTPDSTARSGASDWARLDERMHFITDLFRSSHSRADLFTPPYDAAQIAAMRTGRRPSGTL